MHCVDAMGTIFLFYCVINIVVRFLFFHLLFCCYFKIPFPFETYGNLKCATFIAITYTVCLDISINVAIELLLFIFKHNY